MFSTNSTNRETKSNNESADTISQMTQCFLLQARHIYICDHHKAMIQSARNKQRRRKDSEDDSNETDTDVPDVDLFQLQVNTLRRYKRFYKVATRPGINKPQLADVCYRFIQTIL